MSTEPHRSDPDARGFLSAAARCLPLYVLPALAVLGTLVWMAPVEMRIQKVPRDLGVVDYRRDITSDFAFFLRSPLPLPMQGTADDEPLTAQLPPLQPPAMQAPPPLGDVSPLPESSVLPRKEMLRMPPGMQDEIDGKEVLP